MGQQRNKVCGVDIHKNFLGATILTRDGTKMQKRFGTDIDDLLNFRDWVLKENCDCVAIESTGVYWYPVNAVLENKVELILANAHQIKYSRQKDGCIGFGMDRRGCSQQFDRSLKNITERRSRA